MLAGEKEMLLELQSMTNVDPELRVSLQTWNTASGREWKARQESTDYLLLHLILAQALQNLFYGATLQFEAADQFNKQAKNQTVAMQNEVRNLMDTFDRIEAARLMLPRIARKLAGPVTSQSEPLAVDIHETWGFMGPTQITVQNQTGRTLHYCTVVVRLTGKTGETKENVHFVIEWKPGQQLHADYGSGIEVLERMMDRETVTLIQNVTVSLFCDELTARGFLPIRWREEGQDISRYLEQVFKPRSSYRPYSKGLLWDDQRAVQVSFGGLQFLHAGTLVVSLKKDDQSATKRLPFSNWAAGDTKWIEFGDTTWDPHEWTIQFAFQDTEATRTYRWTRNAEDQR